MTRDPGPVPRTRRSLGKALLENAAYGILRAIFFVVRSMPLRMLPGFSRAMGVLAFLCVFGKPRRVAYKNMHYVLGPNLGWLKKRKILVRSFIHIVQDILLTCRADSLKGTIEERFRLRGEEHIRPLIERGQGFVMPSLHMGAFMLIYQRLSKMGLNLFYTVRRPKNEKVGQLLFGFMEANGVRFIPDKPKSRCTMENLKALRSGGALLLMTDIKHSPEDSVRTDFFGYRVLSFAGGAVLAKRTGAPIVPCVTYKENGAYTLEFFEPIFPKPSQGPEEIVQEYSSVLEKAIERHPDQWWWFHDRFRDAHPCSAPKRFERPLPLKTRLLLKMGIVLYKLLYRSLRIRIWDETGKPLNQNDLKGPAIYCGWHGDQAIIPGFLGRMGANFLVSKSKDGEVFARVVESLGGKVVRGSFQRDGARALSALLKVLKSGGSVAFSPDAPRGPRCLAKEGVAYLALKSGVPAVPFGVFCKPRLVLKKSWDQAWIPFPFSRVTIVIGRPRGGSSLSLSSKEGFADAVETLRLDLEKGLNELRVLAREMADHQRLFSRSSRGVGPASDP